MTEKTKYPLVCDCGEDRYYNAATGECLVCDDGAKPTPQWTPISEAIKAKCDKCEAGVIYPGPDEVGPGAMPADDPKWCDQCTNGKVNLIEPESVYAFKDPESGEVQFCKGFLALNGTLNQCFHIKQIRRHMEPGYEPSDKGMQVCLEDSWKPTLPEESFCDHCGESPCLGDIRPDDLSWSKF